MVTRAALRQAAGDTPGAHRLLDEAQAIFQTLARSTNPPASRPPAPPSNVASQFPSWPGRKEAVLPRDRGRS
jgi:hypothetical protein